MTATITDQGTGTPTGGATGRVSRVIGPVIDAEFPANAMPEIYNALTTEIDLNGQRRTVTFEVAQHLGDNMVRAISLQSTDGLVRGTDVVDTGAPISVPVGDAVKGHIFNVLGETLDMPPRSCRPRTAGRSTARPRTSRPSRARPRCWRPASRSSTC